MKITQGNLKEKFNSFDDHWNPRIIGELNGQAAKIAKVKGEFVWHSHEQEDELFYVVDGKLKIELRDQVLELNTGDFAIIPKGIEHRPVAAEEAHILMFEPLSTRNTGDQINDMTKEGLEKI